MAARPNLLFLWSDQHAPSVAGCYGDTVAETPNLDRLAAEGIAFDGVYCASPICLPSRMSLMTARHPYAQSCWTNQDILPSGIPTMAHSLGSAGFRPTLLGRLHSLGPDQLRGFVHREIGDHSTNWVGGRMHDLGVLDKANDPFRESVRNSGPGQCSYELHDRDVTQSATDYLAELGRRRGADRDQPFAAVVGWMLPHAPYVCGPDYYDRFKDKVAPPHIPVPKNEHPYLKWWRQDRGIADVTHAETMRSRAAYYGLVATLDEMIGRVLKALDDAGLAENTIVVYTTDHGDHLGNRGLWWKSTMYDESARIPQIVRWPAKLAGGQRRKQIVNSIDLTATLLDAMGAPALPYSQGRSFLPVLTRPESPWIEETFSEYVSDGAPSWSGGKVVVQRMIRTDRWKLVYHHGHRPELFDLLDDPLEETDLAERPSHASVRSALMERVLADWDPEAIARLQTQRLAEHALLAAWARAVVPEERYRWPLKSGDNWLVQPAGKRARAGD